MLGVWGLVSEPPKLVHQIYFYITIQWETLVGGMFGEFGKI